MPNLKAARERFMENWEDLTQFTTVDIQADPGFSSSFLMRAMLSKIFRVSSA
jgi:hypothetical protein